MSIETPKNQKRLFVHDVTLRDGMHAIQHQYDLGHIREIAAALDDGGVDAICVGHGDGLSGSTSTYGFGRHTDFAWIAEAAKVVKRAKLSTLLLPGVGTVDDLKRARDVGISAVVIATHSTEADVSAQHIGAARDMGLDVSGFLMMAHMTDPNKLGAEAAKMESYGAHCVYCTDSGGGLTMRATAERVSALTSTLAPTTAVGIHAHQNLSLAVGNSITAVENGAVRVDCSLAGMGAGAGNTPLEAFVAVADLMQWSHGCNLFKLQDAAEELVRPLQKRPVRVDRETLTLGYAGVYSSFLLHAEKAARQYGLDTREILVELGRRKMVGGQEDMIVDVALDLLRSTEASSSAGESC
jgi:4-hydroxy 2-oxovalerate aldolase